MLQGPLKLQQILTPCVTESAVNEAAVVNVKLKQAQHRHRCSNKCSKVSEQMIQQLMDKMYEKLKTEMLYYIDERLS